MAETNAELDVAKISEEADRLLEENNFAAAREKYRAAAIMAPPTRHLLGNLRVAEEQEQLQFSRTLIEKYPESLTAWLDEISNLTRMGWNTHAIEHCTKLIRQAHLDYVTSLHIRRIRFRAVVRSGSSEGFDANDLLIEDFMELWNAADKHSWSSRSWRDLLSELARINDPEAIGTLKLLSQLNTLQPAVKRLLEIKIKELEVLVEAMRDYR